MSVTFGPVSDMLVTVKSREIQRGMTREMRGDRAGAARHFLAAAHLELVLADDYALNDDDDLAFRSQLSAASCFWRAGQQERAKATFGALSQDFPRRKTEIQTTLRELESHRAANG